MRQSQSMSAMAKRPLKLSTTVTLMVSSVIVCVLFSAHLLDFWQAGNITRNAVQDKALAVARTLALQPEIQQALSQSPQQSHIQSIARAVQQHNNLLFVVITNMQGMRYSHPNPQLIGQHFIGDDLNPALAGQENISINQGVLDRALRVFTPVYNAHHQQIGVVAVGISLTQLAGLVSQSRWRIAGTILFGILVGALGILFLVRWLKNILFGLEPYEISSLFEQRQAMLQSMKEGVIAVDQHGQITLINHAAHQLLQPQDNQDGTPPDGPSPLIASLHNVLASGEALRDREIAFNGRVLLANTLPVRSKDQPIGAICTFRDKTEVSELMQRLSGMVNYIDALRERAHEFMNKLHVILGLLHMKNYAQLEQYVMTTASNYQSEIGALLGKIKPAVIAGFILSKMSRAHEQGQRLILSDASGLPDGADERQTSTLITVLGNLIENALEALEHQHDGEIHLLLHYQNGWLACEVSDDGPGISAENLTRIFQRGFSSKGDNRGVGLWLVRQQTESLGGTVSVESEPGIFTQFLVKLPWNGGDTTA
ncbi:two-component system sensor histidine kinase DcuS [Erwinia sp. OLTSP20]|uniref:sensor histidine kinase n=1 Tax=unclassified Erwinia TaxID=2622719 RepID=UPI000C197370|nr:MULTISPECIES: sensor histidine kinase [unclassified Erwinia]PIJ48472.1 two-component system sensor histidine kinase DcuS [Erwinia sp. OAMSP11]PIJ75968.1 two-component system sensor histidine kinase DcuS [Erwinia sp. OLSSP12]PIJ78868.1 two-component system sensor histidine kinase DcuS [Erwinia sp. OLCASP19]PIJ87441.1 two-component system sensor histidine kinase DcuS [Erwinia sp. OLMTSP26]PIJ88991.1 two-component system sensor histidine kinase DcuS [Erwinia sp. OLMDSP33]